MADQFGGVPVASGGPDVFGGKLVENKPIQPSIIEDSPDASGYFDAFLMGLSNNEASQVYWLAERRFPELVEKGMDPSELYSFDEHGDLFYRDYKTNTWKKEFKDGPLGADVDYVNNLGPTGQFLGEVIGGMTGMATGFVKGGMSPSKWKAFGEAIKGGVKGTAKGGATAYAVRAGLSAALGGPPLDAWKAGKDLAISSAFGGIPFGVPTSTAPKFAKGLLDKMPGIDGRSTLADVIQNGGKTVDDKLAYFADRYPEIKISRAEANDLVGSKGAEIERWIVKNQSNEKLINHYHDRNQRVNYHAENFFDFIMSGKYVNQALRNKLTGKASVDADLDVARAVDDYIVKEKQLLKERTAPMYKRAYDTDVKIDVSAELKQIQDVLADANVSSERKAIYKKLEQGLLDANTGNARNTTELLHKGLKDNFRRQLNKLKRAKPDRELFAEVSVLRKSISDKMKAANPIYKEVTSIFDDAFGTAQHMDRSIVGQFAGIIEQGGQRAGTLTKKLFSGNIKPKEIKEFKSILQQTDDGATAWQNLKGTWLRTQWDDVLASQTNPLNQPNAFLRALGVPNPAKSMPLPIGRIQSYNLSKELGEEITEYNLRGTKAKMWEALFEPEELTAFVDMTNMLQMINKIQTAGGSDTFKNALLGKLLSKDAAQIVGSEVPIKSGSLKAAGLIKTMVNLPARMSAYVLGNGFDLGLKNLVGRQHDAYMDLLVSHIVDPKKIVETRALLEATKPITYAISQTFAKGGWEGINNLSNTLDQTEQLRQDRAEIREKEKANLPTSFEETSPYRNETDNLQGAMQNFEQSMPQIDQPLFEESSLTPMEALSPTLLPNEKDREIALRNSGIARLV